MSKDLKDLIDSVEKESKSQAELEKIIHSIKEEMNRLEFTINEQKLLIENLRSQIKDKDREHVELPSEIDLLKDIITSQRKDLEEKDNIIENLNDKILELDKENETNFDINSKEKLNEEFIHAQKLIVQLTEENEQYRGQIEQLQQEIDELHSNDREINELIDNEKIVKENEEVKNFKKLNFQLMQENGLLRVEVESLKAKLHERIDEASSEDLKNANLIIEDLTSKLEDYELKVNDLQTKLNDLSEPVTISTEETLEFAKLREEYDNLKSELLKYQQENQNLNVKLNELEKKSEEIENLKVYSTSIPKGMPKKMRHTLFNRMYRLLDDNNKNKVIDSLIQDLKSQSSETKRNAIKILSQIKDNKVYDAFLEIINDNDWLVRYNLIKALNQYKNKSNEFKTLLKKFSRDIDVDVRELASKMLNNISE